MKNKSYTTKHLCAPTHNIAERRLNPKYCIFYQDLQQLFGGTKHYEIFLSALYDMSQYVTNCYFLPAYNRKFYRTKIKKKIFDWHFLKTRKSTKVFLSRKSQLLLYLESEKKYYLVEYITRQVPTNVIFSISISISYNKLKC